MDTMALSTCVLLPTSLPLTLLCIIPPCFCASTDLDHVRPSMHACCMQHSNLFLLVLILLCLSSPRCWWNHGSTILTMEWLATATAVCFVSGESATVGRMECGDGEDDGCRPEEAVEVGPPGLDIQPRARHTKL